MRDITITCSNKIMESRSVELRSFLDRNDIIGYACARNVRLLTDACKEYILLKNRMVQEYGSAVLDKDGKETGEFYIDQHNDNFKYVFDRLDECGNIEHEVSIFVLTYDEIIQKLTGNEILQLDWMLE